MRKYDKKVLYALVVAYMNGIINRNPLKKWIDKREIVKHMTKYIVFIISFSYLLIVINEGYIIDLQEKVIINGFIISVYRIYNVLLFIPLLISAYKLGIYAFKSYFVNKSINNYMYKEQDIKVLDKVTFKIQA